MTSNDDQFKSITGDNGMDEILSSVKMRLCETKKLNPFVPQHLRRTDTMQIFFRRLIPWRMQIASSTIWIRIESITLSRSISDKDVADGRDVNLHPRKEQEAVLFSGTIWRWCVKLVLVIIITSQHHLNHHNSCRWWIWILIGPRQFASPSLAPCLAISHASPGDNEMLHHHSFILSLLQVNSRKIYYCFQSTQHCPIVSR